VVGDLRLRAAVDLSDCRVGLEIAAGLTMEEEEKENKSERESD
jgi:hypothetical protein